MIFLIVFSGLMLLLGGFYLANSWMEYHEWKSGTIIVALSVIGLVYGLIQLPHWQQQHEAQEAKTEQQVPRTTTRPNQNRFSEMDEADSPEMQHQRESYVLRQMQKNYSKLGQVSYDEDSKSYQIKPSGDTGKATSYLAQHPDQAQQIGWSKLTDSIQEASKALSRPLGKGYSLSVVNPDKPSQNLFVAKDGQVTYNIAK